MSDLLPGPLPQRVGRTTSSSARRSDGATSSRSSRAKTNVKKTDDAIVDSVILTGALETEHHEIAVYEGLIIQARAMGRDDVVRLLEENLEQERHTLEER